MICVHCNEKWELLNSNNKKEKFCPFCGKEIIRIDKDSVVDVPSFLRYIIYVDGDKSLKDLQKIVSLFSDFLPNLIVEKRILRIVLESGVYEKIYASRESITDPELSKYISYLEDDFGLSKKWAHAATSWIIFALDLEISEKLNNVSGEPINHVVKPIMKGDIINKPKNKYAKYAEEYFNIDLFSFPDISFMPKDKTWVLLKDGTLIIGSEDCKYEFSFKCSFKDKIKRVIITKNVTKTQTREFFGLNALVEVVLPPTLIEIGFQCFSECYKLKNVFVQSSLKTIKGKAFEDCSSLTSINIPDSIEYIGDDAFSGCKLKDVIVPKKCALCNGNPGITQ